MTAQEDANNKNASVATFQKHDSMEESRTEESIVQDVQPKGDNSGSEKVHRPNFAKSDKVHE